jgi:hypothetical protein
MRTAQPGSELKIMVNGRRFTTAATRLTGMQIKQLARVPERYEVFLFYGNECDLVADDESVEISDDEHFRAIPPVCLSSASQD